MCCDVGVYLREPRRTNRDGSVVRYLQLAHNERHPVTGSPVAKVIHNFGRADKVDREALVRLVASISRFLEPDQAVAAAAGTEGEILDCRRLGGAWTLDRLWERLGIGAAIHRAAEGRQLAALQRCANRAPDGYLSVPSPRWRCVGWGEVGTQLIGGVYPRLVLRRRQAHGPGSNADFLVPDLWS